MNKKKILSNITCVDAVDFPHDVFCYCVDNEISTHYQNDIVMLEDDGNPFSEWLKDNGYIFKGEDGDWIGIIAT